MKALEFLKELKESRDFDGNIEYKLDEAISELEAINSCNKCDSIFYDEIESCYKCLNDISDDVTFLHGEAVIREPNIFSCCYYKQKDKN